MPRGGYRPGSGAKRKPLPIATKAQAHAVLKKLGKPYHGRGLPEISPGQRLPPEDDLWLSLLLSHNKYIRLQALRYLTDRAEGQPSQSHQVSHTVQHLIAVEEGKHMARKLLALKNRKTLEITASVAPDSSADITTEATEVKQDEPSSAPTDEANRTPRDP